MSKMYVTIEDLGVAIAVLVVVKHVGMHQIHPFVYRRRTARLTFSTLALLLGQCRCTDNGKYQD